MKICKKYRARHQARHTGGALNTNAEAEKLNVEDMVYVDAELQDLIPDFLSNRQKDLQAMDAAISASDIKKIQELGHTLKGVGGSYGFSQLSQWGAQLETMGKQNDIVGARRVVDKIRNHLSIVKIVYYQN